MACAPGCYDVQLASCLDQIVVKFGLPANTDFWWVLKRGGDSDYSKTYHKKVTTDANGFLTIDVDPDLPTGLLNPYSGALRLTIRSGADYNQKISFIVDTVEYTCFSVRIMNIEKEIGDDLEKIQIINVEPQPITNTVPVTVTIDGPTYAYTIEVGYLLQMIILEGILDDFFSVFDVDNSDFIINDQEVLLSTPNPLTVNIYAPVTERHILISHDNPGIMKLTFVKLKIF